MTRALILECWRSGQIEPRRMVELCRGDPALDAMVRDGERGEP